MIVTIELDRPLLETPTVEPLAWPAVAAAVTPAGCRIGNDLGWDESLWQQGAAAFWLPGDEGDRQILGRAIGCVRETLAATR